MKFDNHLGIICQLTNNRATFEQSCTQFEIVFGQEHPEITVERETSKEREKITKTDWLLLFSFSAFGIVLSRLIIVIASLDAYAFFPRIITSLVTLSLALKLRQNEKATRFLYANTKFRLLYCLIFSIIACIYIVLTISLEHPLSFILLNLVKLFLCSFITVPVVKLFIKNKTENE